MKTVDLHTHTTYSDGTYTPKELIEYAVTKGLSAVAVADHDTFEGTDEAVLYGSLNNIEVIRGIEISTEYERHDEKYDFQTEIHIVGLFNDNKYHILNNKLDEVRANRTARNHAVIAKFNEIGIPITYQDLQSVAGGNIITRAHFAKVLLQKGYISCTQECFDKYLGNGKPMYIKREMLSYIDAISLINDSGGIAILAHPLLYKLSDKVLEIMISDLKAAGLTGIEALYSTHSPSDTKFIKTIAQKHKLLISGGSDFHGLNKPKIDLAVGYGNLCVPYEVLEQLKGAINNVKRLN